MPRRALATLIDTDEPTAPIPVALVTSLLDDDETVRLPRDRVLEIIARVAPAAPSASEGDWDQLSAALLEIAVDADGEDVDLGAYAEEDESVWVEFE